jgi:hypothetical protein
MSYRRPIRLVVLTLFVLGLAATQAAAWGPAVHAYFADHAGRIWPSLNRLEMYGATLPDACYFAGLEPLEEMICVAAVHEGYLAMWDVADSRNTKAVGFGFTSHNEEWGADHTAHIRSRTPQPPVPLPPGVEPGYVEVKATILAGMIGPDLIELGVPPGQVHAVCHTLVEAAGDILVKRKAPLIGGRLLLAAALRGEFVTEQFVTAYGWELGAVEAAALEINFRNLMMAYGAALMLDENAAIEALAEGAIPFAGSWDVEEVSPDDVEAAIRAAMAVIQGDFYSELGATARFVRWNLWWHGVWY